MSKDIEDTPITIIESELQSTNKLVTEYKKNEEATYYLDIFQNSLTLLAHIFIGVTVGVNIVFSFRNGFPLTSSTNKHIYLCVIGYQLLMAEAIISLSSASGWSAKLTLVDKRRAHWILQIVGSGLAIAGIIIKYNDITSHWTTNHGIFGLLAFIFTAISLASGVASLYAYELRKFLPGNFIKVSHIFFGSLAFGAAGISLCYGYNKNSYKNWTATVGMRYTLIFCVGFLTFIAILNPMFTIYKKFKRN